MRVMSGYLAILPAVRVDVDADVEVIDRAGQKLQYSASMQLSMQRPNRLRVERRGPFAESQLLFDGETLRIGTQEPPLCAEDGVECQHLAFRAKHVDRQICIRVGGQPLPMKYVITRKWIAGTMLGLVTVALGNLSIGLGTAGGLLIVGIIIGWLGSIMPTFGRVSSACSINPP